MLKGKKIILGVSGSIAAYKAVLLTRLFIKSNCEVKVILTPSAKEFVTPLTFSVLSKNEVTVSFFDENSNWDNHVEHGLWADAFLVAPATSNTLAKMANGICDNALLATYFSAKCPTFVAPAMDLDMWKHPANQRNIETLKNDGVKIIPVGNGELASGLHGDGRMAEPESIMTFLKDSLN